MQTASAGAVRPFLGTYTKSIHAGGRQGRENDPQRAARKAASSAGRYALQRTAAGLLWKVCQEWRDQHRTCWCLRSLKRSSETVSVFRNDDGSGASLAGLNRCGEIWACPVCAAKIAEERRRELSAAMAAHVGKGGAAYLVTLTFPHEADQPLFELITLMSMARQKFKNSRTYKRWLHKSGDAGAIGAVTSTEITVSLENGWHPHIHMLVFADRKGLQEGEPRNDQGDLDSAPIQELKREWVNQLLKVGLGTDKDLPHMMGGTEDNPTGRAFNVRGGDKAAEYIAKFGRDERWGASGEMTGGYAKVGGAGKRGGIQHFTPFQLLSWASQDDGWAAARFREYAEALRGKRAITWTPGLRRELLGGEEERTDEEIAADEDKKPAQTEIGCLDREQYQAIIRRNRLPDFIAYVADAAICQGDLDDYVLSISSLPTTHGGAVLVRGTFTSDRRVIQ
jgi:hypothetical protein